MKGILKFSVILMTFCFVICAASFPIKAANPILPLWERIPDGEPRVFTNKKGETRVYIYGSHDTIDQHFCGYDHVVWSAPLDDLDNWRHDGVAFRIEQLAGVDVLGKPFQLNPNDVLYAPDCVYNPKTGLYYLYVFTFPDPSKPMTSQGNQEGKVFVATSDDPAGPFTNPVFSNIGYTGPNKDGKDVDFGMHSSDFTGATIVDYHGFDPGVLVDVDNLDSKGNPRIFMYWGIRWQYMCELDSTDMATVIPGTYYANQLSCNQDPSGNFGFFEASSIRKIGDKYVLVYSGISRVPRSYPNEVDGGGKLVYAYADNPLGPYTFGGTIINNYGVTIDNPNVTATSYIKTATGGNNHGGLVEINGQWYIFYHRHSWGNANRRAAMVEPVDIKIVDGQVIISTVEMTSQGFEADGLNPYVEQNAASTCLLIPGGSSGTTYPYPNSRTYNLADFDPNSTNPNKDWNPVTNIQRNSWLGYKYFNFGNGMKPGEQMKLTLTLQKITANGTVTVYIDEPSEGVGMANVPTTQIGTASWTAANTATHTMDIDLNINTDQLVGRKAIYLNFTHASSNAELVRINKLKFNIEPASGASLSIDGPVDYVGATGTDATFSVTAAGAAPYTYKWQICTNSTNGIDGIWNNIDSETDETLTVENISAKMTSNYYRCLVTDNTGKTSVSHPAKIVALYGADTGIIDIGVADSAASATSRRNFAINVPFEGDYELTLNYNARNYQPNTRINLVVGNMRALVTEDNLKLGEFKVETHLTAGTHYVTLNTNLAGSGELEVDSLKFAVKASKVYTSDSSNNNPWLLLALYDADGKLLNVASDKLTSASGLPRVNLSASLDMVEGAVSSKAFLWDATTYIPLTIGAEPASKPHYYTFLSPALYEAGKTATNKATGLRITNEGTMNNNTSVFYSFVDSSSNWTAGDWASFNCGPVEPGTYHLTLGYKTATSGRGSVRAFVGDAYVGNSFSQIMPSASTYMYYKNVGTVTVSGNEDFVVRFECTQAGSLTFGYIKLTKVGTNADFGPALINHIETKKLELNIPVGTALGTYPQDAYDTFIGVLNTEIANAGSIEADLSKYEAALARIADAEAALRLRIKVVGEEKTYSAYQDFEHYKAGDLIPFGFTFNQAMRTGSSLLVKEEDGNKFLRLSTPSAAGIVDIDMPYITAISNATSNTDLMIVDYSVRFAEGGRFTNMYMPRIDNSGTYAISVQHENNNNIRQVRVRDGGTARDVATFTYDKWHDFRVVANFVTGRHSVYMDGILIADELALRSATPYGMIASHRFGIDNYANTVVDFDNIRVSQGILLDVTAAPAANGTVTVSSPVAGASAKVSKGEQVTFTLTPDTGYRVKPGSLRIYKTGDSATIIPVTDNRFVMPDYAVTISAEFELM